MPFSQQNIVIFSNILCLVIEFYILKRYNISIKQKGVKNMGMSDQKKRLIYNIISIVVFVGVFAFACALISGEILLATATTTSKDSFQNNVRHKVLNLWEFRS